jgi:hypothetical protein
MRGTGSPAPLLSLLPCSFAPRLLNLMGERMEGRKMGNSTAASCSLHALIDSISSGAALGPLACVDVAPPDSKPALAHPASLGLLHTTF